MCAISPPAPMRASKRIRQAISPWRRFRKSARADIAEGVSRHEAMLGTRPTHFSYPYGDPSSAGERDFRMARELGFRSATTTRKGLIHPAHADTPMRLPRLSLNGDYQDVREIGRAHV